MTDTGDRINLGISSCLLGEKVRYDGNDKRDPFLSETLAPWVDWLGVCPELEAGLGVPRPVMHLVSKKDKIRAVVTDSPEIEHTKALKTQVDKHLKAFSALHGYILKARSPSCAKDSAPVLKNEKPNGTASGVFARRLMKQFPDLPIIESERLSNPERRHNFLVRAFTLMRWNMMLETGLSSSRLLDFHQQHEQLIRCHSKGACRELQRLTEKAKNKKLKTRAAEYRALLMKTLRVRTSRKHHVKTMEGIIESVSTDIDKSTLKSLETAVSSYADEASSLEEALNTLQVIFSGLKNNPMKNSVYIAPYPKSLASLLAAQ